MATIQGLADAAGGADAVVSTDGDSDRPLICGVDPAGKARFFGGDLVGMIVAGYLRADAVVVPISCNDAIDRSDLAPISEPKTRIGSPHVIAGMERARRRGKRAVCGWEANGGFLTGSDIARNSATLSALPTRDAMLPILCTLFAAREKGLSLTELFGRLPRRFGRAGLLRRFPREAALAIIARFSGNDAGSRIEGIFTPELGFGAAAGVDLTDGLRITFREMPTNCASTPRRTRRSAPISSWRKGLPNPMESCAGWSGKRPQAENPNLAAEERGSHLCFVLSVFIRGQAFFEFYCSILFSSSAFSTAYAAWSLSK
ncbi:MAG: hypothetical protein LAQ30_11710 [Acidobacteriia bacterium]|nr:hypothetical protein [Terriglobia bacterium]